jgi:hypothetical protein
MVGSHSEGRKPVEVSPGVDLMDTCGSSIDYGNDGACHRLCSLVD